MMNPYDPDRNNSIIVNNVGWRDILNGNSIENVEVSLSVNRDKWAIVANFYLMDNEKGSIPLIEVEVLKIHDLLVAFKMAGGYEINKFDETEYLDGLDEHLRNEEFHNFTKPVSEFVKFPESLQRKMFRNNVSEYIEFLASGNEEHYLTDYWALVWSNEVSKLKGHLMIYNDTLVNKGIVKKKGAIKSWRK